MHEWSVLHIVGNLLKRATTFLYTSPQSKFYTNSYKHPKWRESQFREFQDSRFGSLRKNDIWVQTPWPIIENTISGKVVISPKFEPWWVLWIRVCPCFIRAPKVLQLCINQLVVWFMQVYMNNRLVYLSS